MDQATLAALLIAIALLRSEPSTSETSTPSLPPKPPPSETVAVPPRPIVSCSMITGDRPPPLAEMRLNKPKNTSGPGSTSAPFRVTEPTHQQSLYDLATFMRKHNCRIRIEGYADGQGPLQANNAAAQARADAVRNYLVACEKGCLGA